MIVKLAILSIVLILGIVLMHTKKSDNRLLINLIICLVMMIVSISSIKLPKEVGLIQEKWSIELPEPAICEEVLGCIGFHGQGISYTILNYRNVKDVQIINKIMRWKKKDSFVQEQIDNCLEFLAEWYEISSDQKRKLGVYKSRLGKEYEYYYMKDIDGLSYGIFIWFQDEGALHVISHTY